LVPLEFARLRATQSRRESTVRRLCGICDYDREMATAAVPRALIAGAVALALSGGQSANAQQPAPCGACLALVIDASQADRLSPQLTGLEILVRPHAEGARRLTDVLESLAARGAKTGIVVEDVAAGDLPETPALRSVVVRAQAAGDPTTHAFELKTRLTSLRASVARNVRLGVWGSGDLLQQLLARDLAAYVDFIVSAGAPSPGVAWWRDAGELSSVTDALRPRGSGAERWLWAVADGDMLGDLAAAARMLPQGLVASSTYAVSCGERKADVWLDPATLAHVALVENCTQAQVRIAPVPAAAEVVALGSGVLVRTAGTSSDRFAEGVNVSAARTLTIQEIVARHQGAAARQAVAAQTRIATGRLSLTFEAPGFPAPLTITSRVTIYGERGLTDMEQQDIRVNGLVFAGGKVPRLPLIEPERVASVPLAIELSDVYRYALSGVETLAGRRCYVVRFEPTVTGRTLFRGTAWIAADDFGLVKVAATQVGLRGPIVSSDQVDEFALVDGLSLLRESRVNQIYEGAGHRTPIERILTIARTEVNPQDFASRRAAAYASAHLMVRDTPQGYRYLRRDPQDPGGGGSPAVPTVERGAQRVRTLAVGLIVDPNISRPLPFAGLSYVDFNLFGTGTQFSGFFGGTFGQMAFSIPSVGGTRWQVAGRAFAIASSFNDRSFDQGVERYERNIRQRPAQASVWALRPITPRVTLRAGYDLDYTAYATADTTSPDFIVPVTQVIHAARIAIEGQRHGWTTAIWWAPAIRQRWRPWGPPAGDHYDPAHRDFQRYGASVTRSAVLSAAVVVRAEGVWLGGHDLDRFSRYSFGAFDNRLRGYPGALIRFDRGGVVRGAVAWAASSRLRIDAFADSAFVRDPGFGSDVRSFTGLGMAVEAPAPFGTLVAGEWGFGIQGRRTDGRRGTHVFRISAYKVF
jgi:hypothetical protein